jgi:L-alanine-DL-glutamate epimerase-like enolase superfamily enzyme
MKISEVKSRVLCAPLREPWKIANATMSKMYATLVYLKSDSGLVGVGECLTRLAPFALANIVEEVLAPILLGRDPFVVERLWEEMYGVMRARGHSKGFMIEAISGVDIALWDLIGKTLEQPIHRLLGSYSSSPLPAYASSILFKEEKAMVEEAEGLAEAGFSGIKLKIGMGLQQDLANVRSLRRALGDGIELMVDANCGYDRIFALRMGRELEGMGISWMEEPLPPEDLEGYAMLSQALDLPIAAGESEFTRYGFRELIGKGKVDVIQPDVARAGGITECRRIAALASAYGIPCAPHTGASSAVSIAASLQLSASLPNFLTFEYMYAPNPLREEILVAPISLTSDGRVPVPSGPGLGIELDEGRLEKFTLGKS